MQVADIDTIDKLDRLLNCYVEYEILINSGCDSGNEYRGSILELLNEHLKRLILRDLEKKKRETLRK